MTTDTRRPFWRSPTIRRQAGGGGALALFAVVWAFFAGADDPTASIFAGALAIVATGVAGAGIILAVGYLFGAAFDRQAARRRAAAKAFADARPDPRNRTGPSITIWPEDGPGTIVAFIEYHDGRVDDLTIGNEHATFGSVVELLYRLAAGQVAMVASIGPVGNDQVAGLTIRPSAAWSGDGPIQFPLASVGRRLADIVAKEAAFRASMGEGPPVATD